MQSGRYSIGFHVLSDSSDTSHSFYSRAVFMAVFAVHPEAIIKTAPINRKIIGIFTNQMPHDHQYIM